MANNSDSGNLFSDIASVGKTPTTHQSTSYQVHDAPTPNPVTNSAPSPFANSSNYQTTKSTSASASGSFKKATAGFVSRSLIHQKKSSPWVIVLVIIIVVINALFDLSPWAIKYNEQRASHATPRPTIPTSPSSLVLPTISPVPFIFLNTPTDDTDDIDPQNSTNYTPQPDIQEFNSLTKNNPDCFRDESILGDNDEYLELTLSCDNWADYLVLQKQPDNTYETVSHSGSQKPPSCTGFYQFQVPNHVFTQLFSTCVDETFGGYTCEEKFALEHPDYCDRIYDLDYYQEFGPTAK